MNETQIFDEEPMVTIDRKASVSRISVGHALACCAILCGTVFFFGGKVANDLNSLMLALLGLFVAGLCAVGYLWIRHRWICVGVLDLSGVIVSTLKQKHELAWEDVVGVRTTLKQKKNAKYPTVHLLLLLDESRCLEASIDYNQFQDLKDILQETKLKEGSLGQELGTVKGIALFCFGSIACILGVWWDFQLIDLFNQGLFPKGNGKIVMIQLALAVGGPIGGFFAAGWALYHLAVRPILYAPGWINKYS